MATQTDIAIRVRGIVNRFGAQTVHNGVDLDVYKGEILGVVGGSGTGKSVLLRSIIGLQHPEAGEVAIFGENARTDDEAAARMLRKQWGVLFQNGALFSSLTVAENIQVPLREYYKMDDQLLAEIAAYKLSLVGLPANAGAKYPSELSGGMRKRAGLARALALDPEILFLDEPTAGLDPIGAAAFDELIRSLRDALGLTVFLITHDLDTLFAICDRIAVLANQKMLIAAPLDAVLDFPHPWVQEYFRGPRARAAAATFERQQAHQTGRGA